MTDPLDPLLRHRDAVRRLATRLVGAAEADDVVQETYLRALRRPPSGDAWSWLTRIATNVVRFRGRSDARRRAREAAAAATERTTEPSAASVLVELEATERVGRALRNLAEPYRTALVQRFFLGWSNAHIAREAGVSEAAVRQRHKRGIGLLRVALARGDGDRPGLSRAQLGAAFGIPLGLPAAPPVLPDPGAGTVSTAGSAFLVSMLGMKSAKSLAVLSVVIAGACLFGAWRLFGAGPAPVPPPDGAPAARSAEVAGTTGERAPEEVDRTAVPATSPAESEPVSTDIATLLVRAVWEDDGTPAGGIVLFVRPWGGDVSADPNRFRATTGDDGTATIEGLPPGRLWVDGIFDAATTGPAVPVAEAGLTTEFELRLRRGALVTGRVVDPDGRGIGGAEVLMAGWAEQWARRLTAADEDGRFRLDGIGGNPSIGAWADGFLPSRLRQLTVGEGSRAEVVIALERAAASVRVRVVDAFGVPITGARVAAGPLGRQNNPERSASGSYELRVPLVRRTDADGRAAVGGLAIGTWPLEVASDGHAGWIGTLEVTAASPDVIEFEVQLGADIEVVGQVTDDSGLPIDRAYVAHGRLGHLVHDSMSTDSNGRFRLRGLPIGEVEMHAQRRGSDLRETLQTAPGHTLRWDPVFQTGRKLNGVVRRSDGSPAAHAELAFSSSEPRWFSIEHADEDGAFTVGMPAEVHAIRIDLGLVGGFRRRVFDGPVPDEPLVVTLGPEFETSARISGHLVDLEGTPVVDARVWYGLSGQGNSTIVELEHDGSFSIAVAPGTYHFRVEANRYATGRATATVAIDERKDLGAIRLEPPAALRVELDAAGALPDELDMVLTHLERGHRHRLRVRGGVGEIGALTAGRYRLQVCGKGVASELREVYLEASDEPTTVAIRTTPGADLVFAITVPDDEPRPTLVTLTVTDPGGRAVLDDRATLRADGTLYGDFALAPGTWNVAIEADDLHGERELVVPSGASESVPVALALRR